MSASAARYSGSSPRLPARRTYWPKRSAVRRPVCRRSRKTRKASDGDVTASRRLIQISLSDAARSARLSLLDQPFCHLEVLLLEREPSGQQGAALGQRLREPCPERGERTNTELCGNRLAKASDDLTSMRETSVLVRSHATRCLAHPDHGRLTGTRRSHSSKEWGLH